MAKGGMTSERAKQEVISCCLDLFERLRRANEAGLLPDELHINMEAVWAYSAQIAETQARVVLPKPISYVTSGRLTSEVEGHQISVFNDGQHHFRAVLNGQPRDRLSQKFVEEKLKIPVQKKQSGGQAGYPSEPVPRAVWRHLADRYNAGDLTVHYERPKKPPVS